MYRFRENLNVYNEELNPMNIDTGTDNYFAWIFSNGAPDVVIQQHTNYTRALILYRPFTVGCVFALKWTLNCIDRNCIHVEDIRDLLCTHNY